MSRPEDYILSLVVPVFNEEDNIKVFYERVMEKIEALCRSEIVFIDDGSNDRTLEEIKALRTEHDNVQYLSLSRNFGHQNALKAGLDFCSGDIVISIDGDLQHPPYLIPKMIEYWQDGYDIVATVRKDIEGETGWFKKFASRFFYQFLSAISSIDLKAGSADFRMLDRKVVDTWKRLEENDLFFRGYVAWSGFRQIECDYVPDKRHSGDTKYTLGKMLRLALNGLLGFSVLPLRMVILLGFIVSIFGFCYGLYAVLISIFSDRAVSGWSSIIAGVYFLGGIQLICIGVCGEYIGRIFMQVKKRPLYIVADTSLRGAESRDM